MAEHTLVVGRGFRMLIRMALSALAAGPLLAATPPATVNYQGVLRDGADAPLTGTYDMVFRFWDAAVAGAEIMVDQHSAAGGNAVTVSGGLFDVALGGGTVADGSGPGTHTALDTVFRDHSAVWLEVSIGAETLTPRTRVHSAPYSLNATSAADATQLAGHPASFFLDVSATPQTKPGRVVFDNSAGTGYGVEGKGPDGGGRFLSSVSSSEAYLASGAYGVMGYGSTMGGRFENTNGSSFAYLGYPSYGVEGYGSESGGFFADKDSTAHAYIGFGNNGIQSYGVLAGGYFSDLTDSGHAWVGTNNRGIQAYGNNYGAYFQDTDSTGAAYLAYQDDGIQAYGATHGGYFSNTADASFARIAFNSYGILAYGYNGGGYFNDRDGSYAYAGYGAYKIYGTGTVSFVQNHPTRKDRTIVYAAPEGDEVAVYTRGSGRLTKGEARIALGETFALVANPDIGVTAHVTPRGDARLWVENVSPAELVVRGPADVDVPFDYMVYALRVGFETLPIVQVKKEESYLPTAATIAEFEAGQPDTVASSALVRYSAERQRLDGAPADLARANALAARINEGREDFLASRRSEDDERLRRGADAGDDRDAPPAPVPPRVEPARTPAVSASRAAAAVREPVDEALVARERPAGTTLVLQAAESTEAGDLVSLDPLRPGSAVKSATVGEALVVGCALAIGDGTVAIATAGVALCRVEASSAPIEVGDLLIASAVRGHAMKLDRALPAPTIVGRAVDPLPEGDRVIRVLLGAR